MKTIIAALLLLACPLALRADDAGWHFDVAPYFWGAGVNATIGVRSRRTFDVDASFSDIMSNFDFGIMARFDARKGRFGFSADILRLNLGATLSPKQPIILILEPEVDMKQSLAEGVGSFRFAQGRSKNPGWAEAIVGARYFKVTTGFHLVGGTLQEGTFDYVDAVAGLRARAPLGSRLGLLARADVAGFGSNVTWNLAGQLELNLSRHWTLGGGYRYFDIDYDKGSDSERIQYQATFKGPIVQTTYSW